MKLYGEKENEYEYNLFLLRKMIISILFIKKN